MTAVRISSQNPGRDNSERPGTRSHSNVDADAEVAEDPTAVEGMEDLDDLESLEDLEALIREDMEALDLDWLTDVSLWMPIWTVRSGFGFKDNVLLSSFNPQDSAFWHGSAELFLTRLPQDGRTLDSYFYFHHQQYLADIDVEREQLGFGQVELKQALPGEAQAIWQVEYTYFDQVLDVSATEADLFIVAVHGHGLATKPGYRFALPGQSWGQVDFSVARQFYEAPLDDYLELGPRLSWEKNYGHGSEWEMSYRFASREYDERTAVDLDGFTVPGTRRAFRQHEGRWDWRHYWDTDRKWQSGTQLAVERNQDRGSGFFDYSRYRVGHRIRYRADRWEASLLGQFTRYQYEHQLADATAAGGDRRRRDEWSLSVRVERELIGKSRLYAVYTGEWVRGNAESESYRVHQILGGVSLEF